MACFYSVVSNFRRPPSGQAKTCIPQTTMQILTSQNLGTSAKHINYWPSIIGTVLLGFGFVSIFQACLNYLVDTFTRFSASAVAANTFMRSVVGAAFPLFLGPMYRKLGVNWGSTIFGCIAACLIPVPFLFFIWGKQLRAKGEWTKFST